MSTETGPSFHNPPVVETALSIQFDELLDFRATHFGMYYETIKERFPVVEDKPRIEPVIESFPQIPRVPEFRVSRADGSPGRAWFTEPDEGTVMLQLQPDRFVFNWCCKDEGAYPSYGSNRPRLIKEFEAFSKFAEINELGEVKPNLCEVTYVNRILPVENETPIDCFASVFSGIDWISSDGWLTQPPDIVTLNRVFTIGDKKGRLYVEAGIAGNKKDGDFVLLKITARVIHKEEDNLMENMDLAHLWVVKSFVSLTNPQIRTKRWEEDT